LRPSQERDGKRELYLQELVQMYRLRQDHQQELTKRKHTCGEIYCKTCKDYFEPTHQCYMLPVTGDKIKRNCRRTCFSISSVLKTT
ncbi:hypothetical protein ScPMuIL_005647, partial [Solemya velum]